MKQAEFDALVERLEIQARTDPKGYRTRVLLLAMLGYAYIGVVVAAVVAIFAGLVWMLVSVRTGAAVMVKAAIPLGTLVFIAARAMWVRLDPPSGRVLRREEAPRLFADAERIARELMAPVPDVILVTNELNASVSQVPRLGIFGWRKNYLVVGLQLMSALHPDYFRAVLAHEFAHLSRAHGHFSGWIYRLRMTWAQLVQMLERDRHIGTAIFSRFFDWYAPYFAAYSFVLARAYEYEADKLAASATNNRDMVGALLALDIKGRELEEDYWPALWRGADSGAGLPAAPITGEMAHAAQRPDPERTAFWAYASLHRHADTSDTHPSLQQRATALLEAEPVLEGEEPWVRIARLAFDRGVPPEDPPVRAAPRYLGNLANRLAAEWDAEWRNGAAENWRARSESAAEGKKELDELDRLASDGTLSMDGAWKRAQLTSEFGENGAAESQYRDIVERFPEHAGARFALGNIMLMRGEEPGVAEVERAVKEDRNLLIPAMYAVTSYLAMVGRHDDATGYRAQSIDRYEMLAEAARERSSISPKTRFAPCTLEREVVDDIVARLGRHPDVSKAWLVRQEVTTLVDEPAHVLAFNIGGKGLSEEARLERGHSVADALKLPAGITPFVLVKANAELQEKIAGVRGAEIYRG
jgi:Zn-dependent protease with chaperone function